MATTTNESVTVAPLPEQNQVDSVGQRSGVAIAKEIWEDHCKALQARRQSDLIREKLLLHIDGSGDLQWADILDNAKVEIPRYVSEFRKTENILRLLADNAVAHHTTMPLRYFADSAPDRRSREMALMDTLWINHLAYEQDFNNLFAEALYLAIPAGFCPVHSYWRDDTNQSYEAAGVPMGLGPGSIDAWVGNPFDTVFDWSARRNSVRSCTYGRVLPAGAVRTAFGHIPAAASLEGSTKMPSAAEFQLIARDWMQTGLGTHGNPLMLSRQNRKKDGSEPMVVVCREIAPGIDARYPEGRLQIIAVPGDADARRMSGGAPVLLADQPLPGGDFSWTNFYSHQRGSDIHGKPWIEDMDQLQIDLNILLSKDWEFVNKQIDSPIITPSGAIGEDFTNLSGYDFLEVEPSLANWRPHTVEYPAWVAQRLQAMIEDKRRSLYTAGGYQAASRGEAPGSRMAYRAIVALQQADSSIHGPVNQRFRRSACDFARRCWKQMKMYGDVPWIITMGVGDQYAYLADAFIDKSKLSEQPPHYKLVNAFGATPELQASELLDLVSRRGADGQPLLTTAEFRENYPNKVLFDNTTDPQSVARRRARTVAQAILDAARNYRERTGLEEMNPGHPWVQQAAQELFLQMEGQYPRLRDDDLQSNIACLTEVTQDETADPLARIVAARRQDLLFQWQAQQAQMGMPNGNAPATAGKGQPGPDQRPGSVRDAMENNDAGAAQPAGAEAMAG